MTAWAASSALLGYVAGVSLAGLMSDRFGRRKALIVATVFLWIPETRGRTLEEIGQYWKQKGSE